MALYDPKYYVKEIVENYLTLHAVTRDDDVTPATDLHLYARGEEDLVYLFFTEDYDVLFIYGEPRVRSTRQIQSVPVHFLMTYPVTVVSVDNIVCTAALVQAKARERLRDAVKNSAQSPAGTDPVYMLTITQEQGRSQRSGGLNIWSTEYLLEWTTGGP